MSVTSELCDGCGHIMGARCADCGREFFCGKVSAPCPREGCADRVLDPKYGGQELELRSGPLEPPRT